MAHVYRLGIVQPPADGVVDTVQDGLDQLRSKPKDDGDEKVKVEVE